MWKAPGKWKLRRCQEHSCGLLWGDPMPKAGELHKLYQAYYTHGENSQKPNPSGKPRALPRDIWSHILFQKFGYPKKKISTAREIIGRIAAHVPYLVEKTGGTVMWLRGSDRGRILDVGCGNGKFLQRMRELGWTSYGIEQDHEAVEICSNSFRLNVAHGTLETVSYSGQYFDAITMSHVVEHLVDPIQTLEECRRLIKTTGCIVLLTPNTGSLGFKRYGEDWRGLEPPRHLHLFNCRNLEAIIRQAGLSVKSIRTTPRIVPQIWLNSDSIKRQRRMRESTFQRRGIIPMSHGLKKIVRQTAYYMWEALALRSNPLCGEEIVAVCTR